MSEIIKEKKLDTKNYNVTDLNVEAIFERHVFHRDFMAHFLRWSYILKVAERGEKIVDFGCGKGNLLEVLYRNKFSPQSYIGMDIRKQTIEKNSVKFANVPFDCKFMTQDLIKPSIELSTLQADKVCSFEVIEHVGKSNAPVFLQNFKACGSDDATYYLSTPNFDEKVGAAENHTYDCGDGNGKIPQELTHQELNQLILDAGFKIIKKYGTFASQKDYKNLLNEHQKYVFNELQKYYDSNLVSVIFAPMFPEQSRNCLWVLKKQ